MTDTYTEPFTWAGLIGRKVRLGMGPASDAREGTVETFDMCWGQSWIVLNCKGRALEPLDNHDGTLTRRIMPEYRVTINLAHVVSIRALP